MVDILHIKIKEIIIILLKSKKVTQHFKDNRCEVGSSFSF